MDADTIKLCDDCNNLMDFCLDLDKNPLYLCTRCNKKENISDIKNINIEFNKEMCLKEIINTNPYLHLDNTLPTLNNQNIKCINSNCQSHKENKTDIKYIKYDEQNIKFIYICNVCGQKWSSDL
jgi:DNA-directed RNA polymerase subunit M/transcription elongation factor TFIIS